VAAAVWADSNFTKRTLIWRGSHHVAEVKAEAGMLYVATGSSKGGFRRQGWNYGVRGVTARHRRLADNFGWFRIERIRNTSEGITVVAIPVWCVVVLSLVVPACALCRHVLKNRLRAYRVANGLCQRCGYDLRGNPGRCPECGFG
jgi:hypothetical protein